MAEIKDREGMVVSVDGYTREAIQRAAYDIAVVHRSANYDQTVVFVMLKLMHADLYEWVRACVPDPVRL